jgi:PHP family Zn ribbon phosphoesterase
MEKKNAKCPKCGRYMKKSIDLTTKKESDWQFEFVCGCFSENLRLSRG